MQETRRQVLDALADGPVAGPDLADRLGVSRAAVWKHVEALREAGVEIESGPDGYRAVDVPEFGAAAVAFGLDAPYDVEYHDAVPSTNDRARELAVGGADGVAVVADEQTGGRGRLDREWASPSGGIWLSVVTRPDVAPARAPLLTFAAAVAVARGVAAAGVEAAIKWPNDVLAADGGKLAGVLTEMEGEADRVAWVVVGMGVNANVDPADLPDGATSLQAIAGPVDRGVVTRTILDAFHDLAGDPEATLSAWRDRADTIGREVRVTTSDRTIEGQAVDVTDGGALVVDAGDGRETVHAGDCDHLRPA